MTQGYACQKQHDFKSYADIHKSVKPLENEKVVHKAYPSSFLETDLQDYLQSQGVEKLVIAGMMSHMCVDTTVRACQNYGYDVTVIDDDYICLYDINIKV